MKFVPLYDKLLVRRSEEVTKVGSLYVPEAAQDKPQEGTVLSCGTGRYEKGNLVPLAVKEGDTILFGKYAGSEIKIDGEDFLILKEEEVLGILKPEKGKARVA